MKIVREFKKIRIETKIRTTGTGLVTTIPKTVVQLLDLHEDDIVEWEIDTKKNSIEIKIQDKQNSWIKLT